MKLVKRIFIYCSPLIIIFLLLFGLYYSRTDIIIHNSPNGDYFVKMYWTDVGGWGWIGKIYLVKAGMIDKKYWTGWHVPATCEWLSENEFVLTGPHGKETFQVGDLINDKK